MNVLERAVVPRGLGTKRREQGHRRRLVGCSNRLWTNDAVDRNPHPDRLQRALKTLRRPGRPHVYSQVEQLGRHRLVVNVSIAIPVPPLPSVDLGRLTDGKPMHVVGIDMCTSEALRQNVDDHGINFIQCDVFSEKFLELDTYDVVLCSGVLYHVENVLSLLFRLRKTARELVVIDTRSSPTKIKK